jgi:hypothetical protein
MTSPSPSKGGEKRRSYWELGVIFINFLIVVELRHFQNLFAKHRQKVFAFV